MIWKEIIFVYSVLGSLMFILYINELQDILTHTLKFYADNGKIIVALWTDRDNDDMQSDINKIINWCETWSMKFSQETCTQGQTNPEEYLIAWKRYVLQNVKKIWEFSSRLIAFGTNKSTLLHREQTGF